MSLQVLKALHQLLGNAQPAQQKSVGQTFNDYSRMPEPQGNPEEYLQGQQGVPPQYSDRSTVYNLQPQQNYNQQQEQIGPTMHNLQYLVGQARQRVEPTPGWSMGIFGGQPYKSSLDKLPASNLPMYPKLPLNRN